MQKNHKSVTIWISGDTGLPVRGGRWRVESGERVVCGARVGETFRRSKLRTRTSYMPTAERPVTRVSELLYTDMQSGAGACAEAGGRWALPLGGGARRETREQGPGSEVEPGVQQIPARPHMMSLFFSRKTQGRTGTLTAVGRRTRDARGKWRQRARGRTPALLRYPSHFPCARTAGTGRGKAS